MNAARDIAKDETHFRCPNCGLEVRVDASACPNCGYQRKRNYWLNLILFGIVAIPAAMATCSVGAVGTSFNLPNDPSSMGAGIVAWFSMTVAPIALVVLLLLVHWQFGRCYRSQADIKSLLPTTWILGSLCVGSTIVWVWCAYKFVPNVSDLIFSLIDAGLSVGIVWDMLRYHARDSKRRLAAQCPEPKE